MRKDRMKVMDGRRGIALVIVLGFLAILTLMAVGMAISMRTERLASKSYLDMVQARMLCNSALADSMVFLEEAASVAAQNRNKIKNSHGVKNLFMPLFSEYFKNVGNGEVPGVTEDWVGSGDYVLPSIESYVGDPKADIFTNSLISGLGTNYTAFIPGRLWRALYKNEEDGGGWGGLAMRGDAQWIHTTATKPDGTVVTNGRFMYLIFNASGLLDVNYLGRSLAPSNDTWLTTIYGKPLTPIPDNDPKYQSFIDEREDDVRYETPRDLKKGNPYVEFSQYQNRAHHKNEAPWDVNPFSYFPPMRRLIVTNNNLLVDTTNTPAFLAPDTSQWDSSDKIKRSFELGIRNYSDYSSAYEYDSYDLYEMLLDYVDDNFSAENDNFERPSVEAVPMVNEFVLTQSNLTVEVWEPFVGVNGTNRYEGEFSVKANLNGNTHTASGKIPSQSEDDIIDPLTVKLHLQPAISNAVSDLEIFVLNDDDHKLDYVNVGAFGTSVGLDRSWQCNDPRFNHLESQWEQYQYGENTLENINTNATYADCGNGSTDGDYFMYCANRSLRCTGELGYLPVAPWRTIKLYEDPRDKSADMDPVLDYFTMLPPDIPAHGFCFLNAQYHAYRIGQSVFNGNWGHYIDRREYRSYGDWKRRLHDVNNDMINISDAGWYLYDEKHGCWYKDWVSDYKDETEQEFSELRLEHLMRRASALLHMRQNLYLVCLWGQALGSEPQDPGNRYSYPIKSEAQAVAFIWRDPYPDEDGHHRKFIRYMRWME